MLIKSKYAEINEYCYNTCILLGVKIGDGCIIGANSVVNKDVSSNSIAVGSPARVIKTYNFKEKQWIR
ncbi:hypothetical protein [Clostridium sp.]|uniref:hypothetical protein n=1 Tax=Clostridium sp. TaxID=1506 RepID=UPI00345C3CFC